jgi:hypothetical protein
MNVKPLKRETNDCTELAVTSKNGIQLKMVVLKGREDSNSRAEASKYIARSFGTQDCPRPCRYGPRTSLYISEIYV